MERKIQINPQKISRINEIAPGVYILAFPRTFDFIPGQVVALDIARDRKPRLYSIASGISDSEIEILFDVRANGYLTPQLSALDEGDTIFVSEPFGQFTDTKEPAWWIATGTGIAPFAAMAKSGLFVNKTLIYGGRLRHSFYYDEVFAANYPQHYIRCMSQENSPDCYAGRLTKFLAETPNLPLDVRYLVCGSAEMVVDVRDLLIQRGVPYKQITAETYF